MTELANRLEAVRAEIKKTDAKILTLDIERLPGTAYVWEPKTRYIPARNFKEWPRMLCFAARWYGDRSYIFEAEWAGGRDRMIKKAYDLLDEADVVVTFNGNRFDIPHMKSDFLEAGYAPYTPFKSVDLYREVKQFGFESKSLDSVTRRLGRPGKVLAYDMDMAWASIAGDTEAQATLQEYNEGDVELTEWLHDRLMGWMPNAPFKGVNGKTICCNQCGSSELTRVEEKDYRAVLLTYELHRCNVCEGLVRSSWNVSRIAGARGVH